MWVRFFQKADQLSFKLDENIFFAVLDHLGGLQTLVPFLQSITKMLHELILHIFNQETHPDHPNHSRKNNSKSNIS
jgi:hypothetical protein